MKDAWHIYRTPTVVNVPAVLVTALCTLVLLWGLKTSAWVNNLMVVAKVSAILVVIVVGAGHVHTALWHPYIPPNTGTFGVYGWSGVFQGTAILFFAYIGFDAVSTMGQETRNPQRTVPMSLLLGLGICAALYLAVSFVVTGLVGYQDLDVPDPMYLALDQAGPAVLWAKYLVAFVALVGLASVLLVTLMGQVRIFFAMGRDGLLPAAFARVHRKITHAACWRHRDRGGVLHRGRAFAAGSARGHHLHGHAAGLRHCLRRRAGAAANPPGPAPALQGARRHLGAAGGRTVLRRPDGHTAAACLGRLCGVAGAGRRGLCPVWCDPLQTAAGRPSLGAYWFANPIWPCWAKVPGAELVLLYQAALVASAVTRSGRPSLFKSPMAMEDRLTDAGQGGRQWKSPGAAVVLHQDHDLSLALRIKAGHGDVRQTVHVEIGDGQADGPGDPGIHDYGLKVPGLAEFCRMTIAPYWASATATSPKGLVSVAPLMSALEPSPWTGNHDVIGTILVHIRDRICEGSP